MKPQPKPTPAQQAPKEESNEQTPKVETNGMDTPQKDNVAATKENLSTTTNGSVNSGSSTPTHSKVDTQSRLFGEQQPREALGRKVRDHQRSNIFGTEEDVRANGTSNGSPRAAGNPVPDTPESKTPDQQQPQQKQRIPPGGFSTKLWQMDKTVLILITLTQLRSSELALTSLGLCELIKWMLTIR